MNFSGLLSRPSVKASWYYAASGTCFALATLFLARVLAPADFGVVALAIAITNVGVSVGSAGMSGVRLRHDIRTDTVLLRTAIGVMCVIGLALAAFGRGTYSLEPAVVLVVFAAICSGGMALLGLVPYQKAHRFGISVPLGQVGNLSLLVSAGVLMALPATRLDWVPTAFVALGFGIVAIWSWWDQMRQPGPGESFSARYRHDSVHFTVFAAADEMMWQLERLLIPILLTIEDLAVFAVVGAVAIAPYHVLASGAGATLIPRLQAEPKGRQRRRLVVHETEIMLGLAVLGGALIVLLVPPLVEWYLGTKIAVTRALLLAAIAGGVARILASIARAPAVAFGTGKELRLMGAGAWVAVGIGIVAAWAMSDLGLIGLILGVAAGWLSRGAVAMALTWHHVGTDDARPSLEQLPGD